MPDKLIERRKLPNDCIENEDRPSLRRVVRPLSIRRLSLSVELGLLTNARLATMSEP